MGSSSTRQDGSSVPEVASIFFAEYIQITGNSQVREVKNQNSVYITNSNRINGDTGAKPKRKETTRKTKM
jgi:hypothetical protein